MPEDASPQDETLRKPPQTGAPASFRSLRAKLLAFYLPLVLLSVVVLFAILEARTYNQQLEALQANLDKFAATNATSLAGPLWEFDTETLKKLVAVLGSDPDLHSLEVFDNTGAPAASFKTTIHDGKQHHAGLMTVDRDIKFKTDFGIETVGRMVAAYHKDRVNETLKQRLQVDAGILLGLAVVLLAVTLGVTQAIIGKPLNRLRETIELQTQSGVREQVGWTSNDELGQVIDAYNDMQQAQAASEKARRESERQFRNLIEGSIQGIFIVDADLNLFFANQAMADIFGYDDPQAIVSAGERTLVAPEEHARLAGYNRARLADEEAPEVYEYRGIRKDGTEIWVENRARKVRWEGDTAIQSTIVDITQRKSAQEELQRHQDHLSELVEERTRDLARERTVLEATLENMDQGISMVDADMKLVALNSKFHQILELPETVANVGASLDDIFRYNAMRGEYGKGDIDEMVTERMDLARKFEAHRFERTRPDGRTIEVRGIPTPAGGFVSTYTDITARKRAQQVIEESRQQLSAKSQVLQAVLESITQGLVAFDGDLTLAAWNERYLTMRDYPPEFGKAGRRFHDFMQHDIERGEFGVGDPEQQLMEQLERAHQFEEHRFERTRPNGSIMEIEGGPIEGGGFVSTYTDITDRRKAERQLADAHGQIVESIAYASRIQRSLLPPDRLFKAMFVDHFMVWQPRDVVGGDLYWLRMCDQGELVVLADCTGHGVPGAFMTIIATGALDQALAENPAGDPGALITRMNQLVKAALGQDAEDGESDDGLELGICRFNTEEGELTFAGARFFLWASGDDGLEEVKGDKAGIGYRRTSRDQTFTDHKLKIGLGARYYMTSDGAIDQIGGERRRAFGKRRIREQLEANMERSLDEQAAAVLAALAEHQGDEARRDDVTMVGLQPFG